MKQKPISPARAAATDAKPIHVPGTPEQVAQSLFNGRPKPRDQWRYLQSDRSSAKP